LALDRVFAYLEDFVDDPPAVDLSPNDEVAMLG